jgi:hypothetical protein
MQPLRRINIAEFAVRENRSPRSIRMTLAFLDRALINAACAGTLLRG